VTPHSLRHSRSFTIFFFCHDAPTTDTYTLSLHDALPISLLAALALGELLLGAQPPGHLGADVEDGAALVQRLDGLLRDDPVGHRDRKSTRLNSSHVKISYAVFCLKKKKPNTHYNNTHQSQ